MSGFILNGSSVRAVRNATRILLGLAASGVVSSAADAQITETEFIKSLVYRQTANDVQPTVVEVAFAESSLLTTNLGDITAADFDGLLDYEQDGTDWEALAEFPSLAQMNMLVPGNATYTISITGGALAPASEDLMLGPDDFPTGVPYLTNGTFDAILTTDPASAIPLMWNTPLAAGAQASAVTISHVISCDIENQVFESISLDPNVNSTVVPAETLIAGERYELELVFANLMFLDADPSGFDAEGLVSNERLTTFEFTAAEPACDGDADNNGTVNFADITSVLNNWLESCP